jgi:hypothetical protein
VLGFTTFRKCIPQGIFGVTELTQSGCALVRALWHAEHQSNGLSKLIARRLLQTLRPCLFFHEFEMPKDAACCTTGTVPLVSKLVWLPWDHHESKASVLHRHLSKPLPSSVSQQQAQQRDGSSTRLCVAPWTRNGNACDIMHPCRALRQIHEHLLNSADWSVNCPR